MSKYRCCLHLTSEETEAKLDEDTCRRVTAIEKQMWDLNPEHLVPLWKQPKCQGNDEERHGHPQSY